jgi:hypothetical protein
MSDWMHIQEVLADMETVAGAGKRHMFSIAWVRVHDSKNGKRGSIKKVDIAMKYTRPGKKQSGSDGPAWQFKDHDAIPIVDVKTDQMLTPKFTHIIEYNGKRVRHYGS